MSSLFTKFYIILSRSFRHSCLKLKQKIPQRYIENYDKIQINIGMYDVLKMKLEDYYKTLINISGIDCQPHFIKTRQYQINFIRFIHKYKVYVAAIIENLANPISICLFETLHFRISEADMWQPLSIGIA